MKPINQLVSVSVLVAITLATGSQATQNLTIKNNALGDEVLELWENCVTTDEQGWVHLDDDCLDELDLILLADEYWGFNYNHSKDVLYWLRNVYHNRWYINLRAAYLPFSFDDIAQVPDRPTMRDVFDIKQPERAPIVDKVLNDPQCAKLAAGPWEIDDSLRDRCHTREIVLYAYWIDACVTNYKLYLKLNTPYTVQNNIAKLQGKEVSYPSAEHGDSYFKGYQTRLLDKEREKSTRGTGSSPPVEKTVSGTPSSEVTLELITEINLKSLWVRKHCEAMPHESFQEALAALPRFGITSSGLEPGQWKELTNQYRQLMGIAVRTGEPWAIQSFEPPKAEEDTEFWTFLSTTNPLLYHRYMGTLQYGPSDQEERLKHVIQAFKLSRVQFGPEVIVQVGTDGETYLPTQRLTHYLELNKFWSIKEYDEDYLDSLVETDRTEEP